MASLSMNPYASLASPKTPTPKRSHAHSPRINSNPPECGPPVPVPMFYRVRFPKAEGTKFVARHLPVSELVELPDIKSLAEAVGGQVQVSLVTANSVASDIEIRIENSFTQLLERIKADL
jgi:hypothetical protein